MRYIPEDKEPKDVLRYFEEICAIPHGSYHVDQISNYLVNFAKDHKLRFEQDAEKNVIIFKDGSKGASKDPIILQGHMDMVLEKNQNVTRDLTKQPIELRCDGDTLYADGTTLGGDDGIAVAMMLAALADKELEHPPLECIFTTNEETGMEGVNALDVSDLKGRRMINLDSEEEGIFTVGCAGGAQEEITLGFERKPRYGVGLHLEISGLRGGHSGASIHLGRANANVIMTRLLNRIYRKIPFCLYDFEGGTRDNAIPRSAAVDLVFPEDYDSSLVKKVMDKFEKQMANEYRYTDPDIKLTYSRTDYSDLAVSAVGRKDTRKVIALLMSLPNGLIERDPQIRDMPQSSLNMGVVRTNTDNLSVVYLVRSSINSQKKFLVDRLRSITWLAGGQIVTISEYPAWERVQDSPLVAELSALFEKENGKKPVISITHGGLECGLLASKIKGLDCVSIGPDMSGVHTPDEKVSISSVERTWKFLTAALSDMAEAGGKEEKESE